MQIVPKDLSWKTPSQKKDGWVSRTERASAFQAWGLDFKPKYWEEKNKKETTNVCKDVRETEPFHIVDEMSVRATIVVLWKSAGCFPQKY
jgi:hypothetical protein